MTQWTRNQKITDPQPVNKIKLKLNWLDAACVTFRQFGAKDEYKIMIHIACGMLWVTSLLGKVGFSNL